MAEASTARYKRKKPLSVFDGVPITAKDEIRVVSCLHKDMLTAFCSSLLHVTHRILSHSKYYQHCKTTRVLAV